MSRQDRINELRRELEKEEKLLLEENEAFNICKIKTKVNSESIVKPSPGAKQRYVGLRETRNISEEFTTKFMREGLKIICTFTDNNFSFVTGEGVASFNPVEGEFNYGFGMMLAEMRAKEDYYRRLSNHIIDMAYDEDMLRFF